MPFGTSIGTLLSQMFPPSPKWSVEDIPDLTGKVAIVTGGNVGIGRATCKELLLKGCTVWLAARSQSKAEEAIAALKKETGKEASFLSLDLNDLNAVKESAEKFKRESNALHILICNAGVMVPPVDQLTAQGYDLQFGTRVVWVGSSVQYFFKYPVDYENLKDTPSRKRLGPQQLYCQSKAITAMLGYQLAKDFAEDQSSNVICIHLDPGNIQTELQRHLPNIARRIANWTFLHPVSKGVLSQLFAATASEAASYNGKYLRPWARLGEPHFATKDVDEQQKIWNYCINELKEYV